MAILKGRLKQSLVLPAVIVLVFTVSACSNTQTLANLIKVKTQADAAYSQHQCQQAIPLYRKLAEKLPRDTLSLLRQGNCFTRLKNYPEAQQAYRQALQRDPGYTKAWFNLSHVQAKILRNTTLQMLKHSDPADSSLDSARALARNVLQAYNIALNPRPASQTAAVASDQQNIEKDKNKDGQTPILDIIQPAAPSVIATQPTVKAHAQ